jgi:hypothetical protein
MCCLALALALARPPVVTKLSTAPVLLIRPELIELARCSFLVSWGPLWCLFGALGSLFVVSGFPLFVLSGTYTHIYTDTDTYTYTKNVSWLAGRLVG